MIIKVFVLVVGVSAFLSYAQTNSNVPTLGSSQTTFPSDVISICKERAFRFANTKPPADSFITSKYAGFHFFLNFTEDGRTYHTIKWNFNRILRKYEPSGESQLRMTIESSILLNATVLDYYLEKHFGDSAFIYPIPGTTTQFDLVLMANLRLNEDDSKYMATLFTPSSYTFGLIFTNKETRGSLTISGLRSSTIPIEQLRSLFLLDRVYSI
eukprot:TRINITY_DN5006_c0_g1_i1.p2 TRINITY_DN5006_c0_g1~~TRINITY_DN5006_c0_g1_i1.p2  ORF type:complete len:212 (+),score=28.92 TRINITY_DN5006_c0_g1_i1:169-804(+)